MSPTRNNSVCTRVANISMPKVTLPVWLKTVKELLQFNFILTAISMSVCFYVDEGHDMRELEQHLQLFSLYPNLVVCSW